MSVRGQGRPLLPAQKAEEEVRGINLYGEEKQAAPGLLVIGGKVGYAWGLC